jgi:hypothetical protein
MPRCSVLLYGNHIQANMRILIVLGANNPTMMTAMPETTKETDRTVSGHPLRLCSKLRNSAFTLCRHFRCSVSVRHCQHPASGQASGRPPVCRAAPPCSYAPTGRRRRPTEQEQASTGRTLPRAHSVGAATPEIDGFRQAFEGLCYCAVVNMSVRPQALQRQLPTP